LRRDKPRVFSGEVRFLNRSDARGLFAESQRHLDIDEVYYWWPDRDDTLNQMRDAFLVRNFELGRSVASAALRDTVPIYFKEVLG